MRVPDFELKLAHMRVPESRRVPEYDAGYPIMRRVTQIWCGLYPNQAGNSKKYPHNAGINIKKAIFL